MKNKNKIFYREFEKTGRYRGKGILTSVLIRDGTSMPANL